MPGLAVAAGQGGPGGVTGCGHLEPAAAVVDRHGLGAFALAYARLGFAPFAVQRLDKRPLGGSNGFKDATTDAGRIAGMWAGGKSRNLAIATGQRSGLLVIDLDVKGGPDGKREFARWLQGLGLALPDDMPYADTPSGGRHLWLRVPQGRAVQSRGAVLPGVDIRADGGYVLAYPSALRQAVARRPGDPPAARGAERVVRYLWHGCPCQAPQAGGGLLDALDAMPGTSAGAGGTGAHGGGGLASDGLPSIEVLMQRGLSPGTRNQIMSRLAFGLWRKFGQGGATARNVEQICAKVWAAGDSTGFPWSEARKIVDYARRSAAQHDAADARSAAVFLNAKGRGSDNLGPQLTFGRAPGHPTPAQPAGTRVPK